MPKKKTEEPSETPQKPKTELKFRSAIKNSSFDIFAEDLKDKAQHVDGFKSLAEVAADYLPIPWMAMQYVIGRVGIPLNTIVEFIGEESVGKSSLMHAIMGNLVAKSVPCLYINSEPKQLEPDWRRRMYHTDPAIAAKIDAVADYKDLSTLDEMDSSVREWITMKREVLSKDIPLVVIVDSITKLMNPEEAAAAGWDTDAKTKKDAVKGVMAISKKPAVTAKWMHQWSRVIAPILRTQNVTLLLVSGQNQDMNLGEQPAQIRNAMAKRNKTRTGGNAINQSAAIQITMTRSGYQKNSDGTIVGKKICLYGVKTGYGASNREIHYILYDDRKENYKGKDVPGKYQAPAIDMDEALCSLLVNAGAFGLTLNMKKYTSAELGLAKVKADAVVRAIYDDPARVVAAAKALSINGYECE